MKKLISLPLIITLILGTSCSNNGPKLQVNNDDTLSMRDSTQNSDSIQVESTGKVYKGRVMDKSKYPSNLYVIMPEQVRSSGYLNGSIGNYQNENLIDHDPFTWWTPDPKRSGPGAWFELKFHKNVNIEGFEIWGGSHNPDFPKYGNLYNLNNRLKKGICEFSDGRTIQFELLDVDQWQFVKFDSIVSTKIIRLRVTEVYKGEKWDDLCISEFMALSPDPDESYYGQEAAKPVIYLYPETETRVQVRLDDYWMNGILEISYPEHGENGWDVTAYPDGKLIDRQTHKEYQYLFWEGRTLKQWTFPDGFVVKGSETARFLEEKLSYMGLIPKEYNDFIVYWLPLMAKNEYNLVRFVNAEYNRDFPLVVNPSPESMLRVYMIFKPLDGPIAVPEQNLPVFNRKGFTLIEWGGSQISRPAL